MNRKFISTGHLIDSGILSSILNLIIEEGADYEILEFTVGKINSEESRIEIELITETAGQLETLTTKLIQHGCYEKSASEAGFTAAEKDKCAPEPFYSTTNHRTEVYLGGSWHKVEHQRMDAAIIKTNDGLQCRKIRDLRKGDPVLINADSVRIFPPARERQKDSFGFMSGEVSSERAAENAVNRIAEGMKEMKKNGEKVVVVAGPVVIHTGGASALASLIEKGYVTGLLAGNALAVHDLESEFYGTSLGVDLKTGRPTHEGHKNHMRAINRIYRHGSIAEAVENGDIESGVMHTVIKTGIPYCLAGSIRDDGPLPEIIGDVYEAQNRMRDHARKATTVICMATQLHSIAFGNMTPSYKVEEDGTIRPVYFFIVDMSEFSADKLANRGSAQAQAILTNVQDFIVNLWNHLKQ